MPIIDIELVIKSDAEKVDKVTLQRLTNLLGDLLGSDPGGTWAQLRYLHIDHYAENRAEVPATVQPTMVRILQYQWPPLEQRVVDAFEIARTVAEVLGRPRENTHVFYEPEGKGRVAFGGVMSRDSS